MGDETKDYEIWLDEYSKDMGGIDIGNITVSGSDINYQDWLNDYISNININEAGWAYEPKIGANDISLTGGGEEMLRVAEDGFYVRGVKVKQGKREAKAVYEAFKKWMTHAIMSGELNDR